MAVHFGIVLQVESQDNQPKPPTCERKICMRTQTIWTRAILTALAGVAIGAGSGTAFAAQLDSLDGRWAATLAQGSIVVPFRLDISSDGDHVKGTLFNGEETETTTSASIANGSVQLNFEHYLTRIEATVKHGELDGQVIVKRRSPINITPGASVRAVEDTISEFHAKRYVKPEVTDTAAIPSIDGVWEVPHESPKGEKAW